MKNLKKLLLSGTVLFLFSANLFAQGPDTLWTKLYGGADDEAGFSIQNTFDGGFIIIGGIRTNGMGDWDFYLLRTDENGDSLWAKSYGGNNWDMGYSVAETPDSGYLLLGETESFGAGEGDVYVIRADKNGDTLWTKTFGGAYYDKGHSIRQTIDNNYIIVGSSVSFGPGGWDIYLLKLNNNGDTLWTRTFGGSSSDFGWDVQETSDSGYVIVGSTGSFSVGEIDVYIIKTNVDGNIEWARAYGGLLTDEGWSVQQTLDGGYIVVGKTNSFTISDFDAYLLRLNNQGDTLWTRTYCGQADDGAKSVQKTLDGRFIIAGTTESILPHRNFLLLKVDTNGDSLWASAFGGDDHEFSYEVLQLSDGAYIIVGVYSTFSQSDVYLIKTNPLQLISPNGSEIIQGGTSFPITWWCEYPKSNQFNYRLLFSQDQGNTYPDTIADQVHKDSTSLTWNVPNTACITCRIKIEISDILGIALYTNESDSNFTITQTWIEEEKSDKKNKSKDILLACQPNPFTTGTYVQILGASENLKGKFDIYAASGRLVKSVKLTSNSLQLGADLVPGIYFLKLDDKTVGKVVKVR